MSEYLSSLSNGMRKLSLARNELPISKHKDYITQTVQNHQIVIIFGETGSGKTTQIPQYLLDAGINEGKIIGVTQPRRIAAISMASRVSQEMGSCLGMEVGYEVRFNKRFTSCTKIKFMTDGILLNQCVSDVRLSEYGVIMIDEAHERSVDTDVLLGLLKMIIEKRKDLKILITSATMNTTKFTNYFKGAPVISVEGKMYNVEIIYHPIYIWSLSCIRDMVYDIERKHISGDVLVFLTGQEEIEECCEILQGIENLVVMPLYGALAFEEQERIFRPVESGKRKVIVSTNIAETSITVDGIRFVIDSGYVKQNQYNPQTGIEILQNVKISQSQADQRRGRAGRTNTGWCYRCYTSDSYGSMNKETTPDIHRRNLCSTYLKIVAIGLDPMTFPFIDSPDIKTLKKCLEELQDLEFINNRKELTELGRMMENFPVEPKIGKVLINASKMSCSEDIVTILAMLTERNVFTRPKKQQSLADMKKKQFFDSEGDHFMLLNVFTKWSENNKTERWCRENFVNFKTMQEIDTVRDQLVSLMRRQNMALQSASYQNKKESIKKAIISGFYKNICFEKSRGVYINYCTRDVVYMYPGSCLMHMNPHMVLFQDVVQTKKPYMRGIMSLSDSLLDDFPKEKIKINYNHRMSYPKTFLERLYFDL